MAVMPGVDYRPISYSGVPRMTRYDIVCIHTIVGNDPATAAHFSTRGNGWVTQSRDTFYQSAANYEGNYRVLAIENDDHGAEFGNWNTSDGHAVPAFTGIQCESIAHICAWAYKTHGIPLVACPDSKPGSRGIAYHRQGIDGNWAGYAYGGRVPGGELWSKSAGKVCPGDRRIKQVLEVIIPRARVLAGLDGGFMTALTDAQQQEMYARVAMLSSGQDGKFRSGSDFDYLEGRRDELEAKVDGIASAVAALAEKVDQIAVGNVDIEALADATADELDKRARDNDPTTGPTS